MISQRAADVTPGACRQFHASPFFSGVEEGAPCHSAYWVTVAMVFGEFLPFRVNWEAEFLHPTRENHPEKLDTVLVSCGRTYPYFSDYKTHPRF